LQESLKLNLVVGGKICVIPCRGAVMNRRMLKPVRFERLALPVRIGTLGMGRSDKRSARSE
jgi:hypothetical protein